MDDERRAYGSSSMQIESYYGPPRPPPSYDFSTQSASSYPQPKISGKKSKSTSGSSSSKSFRFADPEFQRKKRIASYKMYSVEGKMKGSFRNSFRWLKDKYTQMLYGWW